MSPDEWRICDEACDCGCDNGVIYVSPEALAQMDAEPVEPHMPFVRRMRALLYGETNDEGADCD